MSDALPPLYLPERPARKLRPRGIVPLVLGISMATLWSWEPSRPLEIDGVTVTSELDVGEVVQMPDVGNRATVRVDRVEPVWWCTGGWWEPRDSGVLFSGPITRVTVTVAGIPNADDGATQAWWSALNLVGNAYESGLACECDGSCEAVPKPSPDGLRYTVLLFTGGTLSGLAFTPEPGLRYEWTL